MSDWWRQYQVKLGEATHGASLAFFRMGVGLVLFLEACSALRGGEASFSYGALLVEEHAPFYFKYPLLEWVPVLPAFGIKVLLVIKAAAALCLLAGLYHRIFAGVIALIMTYFFMAEVTWYQNHIYLEWLLVILLIILPASGWGRIDTWLRTRCRGAPDPSAMVVPWVSVQLLRLQWVIVYFFAGIAKVTRDNLENAQPLLIFQQAALQRGVDNPVANLILQPERALMLSQAAMVFDLCVGFLLLWRKTRLYGFAFLLLFHGINNLVLFETILNFGLLSILCATIFFDPDWPVKIWRKLQLSKRPVKTKPLKPTQVGSSRLARFAAVWVILQVLIPLRHFLIAGDVRWTREGERCSWQLKPTSFSSYGGMMIRIRDPELQPGPPGQASAINWTKWKGDRVVYTQTSGNALPWPELPEFVVLVEPLIGERVIYNSRSRKTGGSPGKVARIKAFWQERFQRPLVLEPTFTLTQILEAAAVQLGGGEGGHELRAMVSEIKDIVHALEAGMVPAEERPYVYAHIQEVLRSVLSGLKEPEALNNMLRRGTPFILLEPSSPYGNRYLVVDDPVMIQRDESGYQRVNRSELLRLQGGGDSSSVVHIYGRFDRLAQENWRNLPLVMVANPDVKQPGYQVIQWNGRREMARMDYYDASTKPFLIHRYVTSIKKRWKKMYGRQPEIRVDSLLSMNGRPPQAIVDPQADLASEPFRWMGHNTWIPALKEPAAPRLNPRL